MGDVSLSDAGGVSLQLPVSPLRSEAAHPSHLPLPTTDLEADLYANLKKLQRDLEFLSLQEVLIHERIPSSPNALFRNTSKTSNEA
jgi:hypothetical protein